MSVEEAHTDYGVVIAKDNIDDAATLRLRAKMQKKDTMQTHFDFGPERENYERHWTPEAYDAMTEIMASLPNHWRFSSKPAFLTP